MESQNANKDTPISPVARAITNATAVAELAAAYVKAYGEIDNVVKNAANPHFKSNYADLGAVLDTIRPVFAANGLALLQCPGAIDGGKMSMINILMHTSGQSITITMQIPLDKGTAQAYGSATSYARRYCAAAIAGVAQVDDDGNEASAPKKKEAKGKGTQEGPSYADTAEALMANIQCAVTVEALEAFKAEVADLGDQKVADAYVTKKRELRAAKGAK